MSALYGEGNSWADIQVRKDREMEGFPVGMHRPAPSRTSFPYLKIARDFGVSYQQIMDELQQVELSEFFAAVQGHRRNIEYTETLMSSYRDRQRAIREAYLAERARREQVK